MKHCHLCRWDGGHHDSGCPEVVTDRRGALADHRRGWDAGRAGKSLPEAESAAYRLGWLGGVRGGRERSRSTIQRLTVAQGEFRMFCHKCQTWFHLEPSQHQRCHKCREWFHLSDGGFLEELDARGKLIFVCEGCEPNMAPRDDEWTRDLGGGRILVMELVSAGYRATLMGFCGGGMTQGAALDDLLAKVRDYGAASDDFERSLAPGGHLSERLRQIEQLVGQIAQGPSQA